MSGELKKLHYLKIIYIVRCARELSQVLSIKINICIGYGGGVGVSVKENIE